MKYSYEGKWTRHDEFYYFDTWKAILAFIIAGIIMSLVIPVFLIYWIINKRVRNIYTEHDKEVKVKH